MKTLRLFALISLLVFLMSGCATKAQSGALLGTLLGAGVGYAIGGGKGAAIGAAGGIFTGYMIGNELDKQDQKKIYESLENNPSGTTTTWENPDNRNTYSVTPQPGVVQPDNTVVREFTMQAMGANGQTETIYCKAKRMPDGSWQMLE